MRAALCGMVPWISGDQEIRCTHSFMQPGGNCPQGLKKCMALFLCSFSISLIFIFIFPLWGCHLVLQYNHDFRNQKCHTL